MAMVMLALTISSAEPAEMRRDMTLPEKWKTSPSSKVILKL